jgi:hypothetical protein|tara:strand:- start:118 stop:291 length:174 start_codon:yes stop_codon:yes gene_type:complete
MIGKLISEYLFDPEMEKEIIDKIVADTDIPVLSERSEKKIWTAIFKILKAVILKKLA